LCITVNTSQAGNSAITKVKNFDKSFGGEMRTVDVVAAVLLVVGGVNWGLVGIAHFGETSMLSAVVYSLVGLAALYQAVSFKAIQRRWGHDSVMAR
jgi:uncharacterized protein